MKERIITTPMPLHGVDIQPDVNRLAPISDDYQRTLSTLLANAGNDQRRVSCDVNGSLTARDPDLGKMVHVFTGTTLSTVYEPFPGEDFHYLSLIGYGMVAMVEILDSGDNLVARVQPKVIYYDVTATTNYCDASAWITGRKYRIAQLFGTHIARFIDIARYRKPGE